ncbi:MAG: transitional endoplasmic reticulum ATPase [Frankiaceae bacterium]|jgi:transitional endoplasmic reticulum ATPase|nr:transitional endoplasmic reticulum ATPase [Frankiaceae bacterium]
MSAAGAEGVTYRRNAARLTRAEVLHQSEKDALVANASPLRRRKARADLGERWAAAERAARNEATDVLALLRASAERLGASLDALAAAQVPDLLGAVETEHHHVRSALDRYAEAADAVDRADFGAAGAAVDEAERELTVTGRGFVVTLNRALAACAVSREVRGRLEDNLAERRQAKQRYDHVKTADGPLVVAEAAARLREVHADGFLLAAEVLGSHVGDHRGRGEVAGVGRENTMRVLSPHDCETFADVGGLQGVKKQLRETVGALLERPDEAARYGVTHNGVLFYGPPGTGKNLLSRALAGEYGMRYLRFSPATIASAYVHEAAANLRHVFELALRNAPCVLYLDEIDTIASDRSDQPSADHREVVTQLMVCLEEYRKVPGLVICAGTNELDRLDPALREGRFDAKVLVPLPDADDRAEVIGVHLRRRDDAVDWESVDLPALARVTHGYNAAALETVVSLAAQAALREDTPMTGALLERVVAERGGGHRITLEQTIGWDDVVLADETRERVMEILTIFARPELARRVGVSPPAGILLFGPPGTGKTTIAKAMASQTAASFYEMSAADLLSKWAGESEQKVAKLFTQARANRPSIIFVDEIDALLRRRSGDSTSKWEERVLSQFLRELDGIRGGDGVLLVGATNRLDTIDEAVVGRRLEPVEVGLPDALGRLKLLQLLCRDVTLAKAVNLRTLTNATEGMSGSDLRRLRDAAGRKALSRAAKSGKPDAAVNVTMADFQAALDAQRTQTSLAAV